METSSGSNDLKNQVQRIAAFTLGGEGGNPAGVLIGPGLPAEAEMQAIAAEVGYSETVFAAETSDGFRVRYFAPQSEVAFCGHATIALGAALGAGYGAGQYRLTLNNGDISVEAFSTSDGWGATLVSPPTRHEAMKSELLAQVLSLFGWAQADLDPHIPPARIEGGATHLLLALKDKSLLQTMSYDFETGASLMQHAGLVTVNLIWQEAPDQIHARNPFAGHGVYEDPATGAAAAALAGYLRDASIQNLPFDVIQGVDMGLPSRLRVVPQEGQGSPIEITGLTRVIHLPES